MKLLGPSQHARLNEVVGVVFLFVGILLTLSLISYHPGDPSWDTVTGPVRANNLFGSVGAHVSDSCLQAFGLGAFTFPLLVFALAWKWLRSQAIDAPFAKLFGSVVLLLGASAGFTLAFTWRPFGGAIAPGGICGILVADYLVESLNDTGAAIAIGTALLLSLYLVSTFSMAKVAVWFAGPIGWWRSLGDRYARWRERRREIRMERAQAKAEERAERRARRSSARREVELPAPIPGPVAPDYVDEPPPFEIVESRIPIRTLEDEMREQAKPQPVPEPAPVFETPDPAPAAELRPPERQKPSARNEPLVYETPPASLLNEPPLRNGYDEQELKDIAARIKSKFEEFNVFGSVVQINPGPVVTTYEFKPEAGIKYSRITTLSEDLCLGLQAESILIERIPGKPTVGIQVPNTRREVISLRQVLESEEFQSSPSRLTMTLGKDISGRIKVAAMESMPHLLIAGSTGSGKSVMLNSMIMSVLYKTTPDEVRLIMVDPKRVELGIYEGIPHLLTPVITDAKKATNALRNAVLEMERRLKLLASQGVRNIDQYNKKVRQLRAEPKNLFTEEETDPGDLQPLPYILILIDELADLMMLERGAVEETVTRLAQMARAVGMHLVLATQRPSVDVITGLIKANFPARISFRVATRVDSRTILDVMGAEHLLGKGDMLFLPPGSARLIRVHGAFVTEAEINRVVEFWKNQAAPDYDQSFLRAPPSEEDGGDEPDSFDGGQDPMYEDAVRIVVEMGKASTSTLQRRLRLGYGRAARILDLMQRDGIIGPPDGSRPREVLKRPDWLHEIEDQMR